VMNTSNSALSSAYFLLLSLALVLGNQPPHRNRLRRPSAHLVGGLLADLRFQERGRLGPICGRS